MTWGLLMMVRVRTLWSAVVMVRPPSCMKSVGTLRAPTSSLEFARHWLRANRPPRERTGVVHGDFRNGNLLWAWSSVSWSPLPTMTRRTAADWPRSATPTSPRRRARARCPPTGCPRYTQACSPTPRLGCGQSTHASRPTTTPRRRSGSSPHPRCDSQTCLGAASLDLSQRLNEHRMDRRSGRAVGRYGR
jgi:hypothetical protein